MLATEGEATILAARLVDVGIDAWVEGGITAGYRAEAPGGARLLVHQRDLEQAAEILNPRIAGLLPPRTPPTTPGPIQREHQKLVPTVVALAVIVWIIWGILRGTPIL